MESRRPRAHREDLGVGRGDWAGCPRTERGLSVQPVGGAGRDIPSPANPRSQLHAQAGIRVRRAQPPSPPQGPIGPRPGEGGAPAATAGTLHRPPGPRSAAPARPGPSPGRGSPGPSRTLLQVGTPLGQSRPLPPRARLRRGSDSSRVSAIESPPATRTAQRR